MLDYSINFAVLHDGQEQTGILPDSLITFATLPESVEQTSIRTGPFVIRAKLLHSMERETGIEPALVAWKATVLPLNYSRAVSIVYLVSSLLFQASSFKWWGRCITPGILPCALQASLRLFKIAPGDFVEPSFCFGGSHPPLSKLFVFLKSGGGRWIRTTEGVSQQIYSLPPLAAWVSLRNFSTFRYLSNLVAVDDFGHRALRPAGQPAAVQNRSRRFCRTTEDVSQQIYSLPRWPLGYSFAQSRVLSVLRRPLVKTAWKMLAVAWLR